MNSRGEEKGGGQLVKYSVEVERKIKTDCPLRLDLVALQVAWLLNKVIVHI